jgi:hypothetical protein
MLCAFSAARRDGHACTARGKRGDKMAAEKATTTEDEEVFLTHDRNGDRW